MQISAYVIIHCLLKRELATTVSRLYRTRIRYLPTLRNTPPVSRRAPRKLNSPIAEIGSINAQVNFSVNSRNFVATDFSIAFMIHSSSG